MVIAEGLRREPGPFPGVELVSDAVGGEDGEGEDFVTAADGVADDGNLQGGLAQMYDRIAFDEERSGAGGEIVGEDVSVGVDLAIEDSLDVLLVVVGRVGHQPDIGCGAVVVVGVTDDLTRDLAEACERPSEADVSGGLVGLDSAGVV